MIRIAVVHTRPSPPWSARQLMLALEGMGVSATYLRPDQMIAEFGGGVNTVRVQYHQDIDAFILRDIGFSTTIEQFLRRYALFKHLEMLGKPIVNPVDSIITARNKYLSLLILASKGIPVPRTFVTEDPYSAYRVAQQLGRVVIKPIVGSMGFGALMLEDADTAFVVARTLAQLGQPIYVQQYVEKPNRDIRVFVIGDEVVAAYYRVHANSWKTNIAQGAKPKPLERIDPQLEELAIRCCKILSLHYAGVDVAESREGYTVLEVNASPGWRGLVTATGINPATRIAQYVVSLCKK